MNLLNRHPNAAASGAVGALGVLITYILTAVGVDITPELGGVISAALSVLALVLPGPKSARRR